MENLVPVELLVKKTVADEIMQKKMAEIALRRVDAKFRAMVKCPVVGKTVSNSELLQKISTSALEVVSNQNLTAEQVRKEFRNVSLGLKSTTFQLSNLTNVTKNLSIQVDGICQATRIIEGISFLNLGVSLVNLGVTAIGLVIIGRKINEISDELKNVEKKLDKIAHTQKTDIKKEFERLRLRSKITIAHIKDGVPADLNEVAHLIVDLKTYMEATIDLMDGEVIDIATAMTIIYTLSPAYSILINEYVKLYYFVTGSCPEPYEDFLAFYQLFLKEDFLIKMQDYYYLECHCSGIDTIDMINAQILMAMNAYTTAEDQVFLLNSLGSEERYMAFEKELDNCAENLLLDHIDEIAEKSGIDKDTCLELIVDDGKKIA